MYQKLDKALKKLHRGQRGMTGLETAIILIAFVTVASVLAYSVLSAGIFSAERGKATVYSGLEQAQATTEIKGTVIAVSNIAKTSIEYVEFLVGLTIPEERVDMTAIVIKYFDDTVEAAIDREDTYASWTATSYKWASQKAPGSSERGSADMLEGDELHIIKVSLPSTANVGTYATFTVQLIPPKGATLTVSRTTPGALEDRIDLQ